MKNRMKQTLDYLPFVLLVMYTVSEWFNNYVTNIQIQYRTYAGIILLLANAIAYTRYHQLAVLLTGLICLLGFFKIIMVSPAFITYNLGATTTFGSTSFVTGSIYFIGIFILHFILSFRFYAGIATKKYWKSLAAQTRETHDR